MNSNTKLAIQIVSILTVCCWILILVSFSSIFSKKAQSKLQNQGFTEDLFLKLRSLVLVVATLGSLYFSEIANFAPCDLCWVQRMFIFPLAAISIVAIFNKTKFNYWLFIIASSIGACVSIYHILMEKFPSLHGVTSCDIEVPCTVPPFTYWGFLTLACMALTVFIATIVLTITAQKFKEIN